MVNPSERPAVAGAKVRYFLLAEWCAPHSGPVRRVALADHGQFERFLGDWQRRCLPIPWCSATSADVFKAYRFWAQLQGINGPASMNAMVLAACSAGMVKSRHRIRFVGQSQTNQHVVLHPQSSGTLKSGQGLDEAATAFAAALAAWKLAAGHLKPQGQDAP